MTTQDIFSISPVTYCYLPDYNPAFDKPEKKVINGLSNKIIKIVSDFYGVSFEEMKDKTRKRDIVTARQVCMAMQKKHTILSFKVIGKMFGDRDHTTVIHSINTVNDLIDSNPGYRKDIEHIDYCIIGDELRVFDRVYKENVPETKIKSKKELIRAITKKHNSNPTPARKEIPRILGVYSNARSLYSTKEYNNIWGNDLY
jgi:hypothetical protein